MSNGLLATIAGIAGDARNHKKVVNALAVEDQVSLKMVGEHPRKDSLFSEWLGCGRVPGWTRKNSGAVVPHRFLVVIPVQLAQASTIALNQLMSERSPEDAKDPGGEYKYGPMDWIT